MKTASLKGISRAATAVVLALVAGGGGLVSAQAHDGDDGDEAKIRRGFDIAPVHLNLAGKDRALVGLGSYLVNAVGSCNMCHSAGPTTEFTPTGNPYFKGNLPKVINQATYLGGGRSFTPPGTGSPAILSRNLTPDRTGRPAGGMSFAMFREVMRTGIDFDHVHPNCPTTGPAPPGCYPAASPYDGDLLQVMPWPEFQSMTEHDLRAIYEYLSAVPCITGPPAGTPPPTGILHNDCI